MLTDCSTHGSVAPEARTGENQEMKHHEHTGRLTRPVPTLPPPYLGSQEVGQKYSPGPRGNCGRAGTPEEQGRAGTSRWGGPKAMGQGSRFYPT